MKRPTNQSLTKLADAAFLQAAKKVIERAEATGTPVIVWENDTMTKLTPRQARKKTQPVATARKRTV